MPCGTAKKKKKLNKNFLINSLEEIIIRKLTNLKIGLLCFRVNYVSFSCDGGGNKSHFALSTPCASGTTLSSLQHSGLVPTTALGGRYSFQVRKHR